MKKLISFFFVLLLVFSACTTQKKAVKVSENAVFSQTKGDSTFHSIIQEIKDTVFISKPDSASIRALIRCDQQGRAYLQQIIQLKNGRRIEQHLRIRNNILTASATIDSAKIYFQYKQTHEREFVQSKSTVKKEKTKNTETHTTKNRMPPFCWYIIIAITVYLAVKYLLPLIKPRLL